MIAITLVIGVFVVLMVVRRAIRSTVRGADRAIRHNTYESNVAEASTELLIYAPVPPSELIAEIVSIVNAHESAPAMVAGLYLKARTKASVSFGLGNKVAADHFVAQVALRRMGDDSAGWFRVLAWQESGAEVHGKPEMTRLRERIIEAVENLGGTARAT